MDHDDVVDVLTKVAAYDRRTVGEADVLAWLEVIGDLDRDDCLAAVAAHYADETRWLMPADVRRFAADAAKRRKAAERRALLREAGWPDTEGTTATGPATRDRKVEIDAAMRRIAGRKSIDAA